MRRPVGSAVEFALLAATTLAFAGPAVPRCRVTGFR